MRASKQIYETEIQRLDRLFWEDATEELDATDIPNGKLLLLQDYAYDKGHSVGYDEIFNHYCDIIYLYRKLEAVKQT